MASRAVSRCRRSRWCPRSSTTSRGSSSEVARRLGRPRRGRSRPTLAQRIEHLLVVPVAELGPSVMIATMTGRVAALGDALARLDDAVEQVDPAADGEDSARRRFAAAPDRRVVGEDRRPLGERDQRNRACRRQVVGQHRGDEGRQCLPVVADHRVRLPGCCRPEATCIGSAAGATLRISRGPCLRGRRSRGSSIGHRGAALVERAHVDRALLRLRTDGSASARGEARRTSGRRWRLVSHAFSIGPGSESVKQSCQNCFEICDLREISRCPVS